MVARAYGRLGSEARASFSCRLSSNNGAKAERAECVGRQQEETTRTCRKSSASAGQPVRNTHILPCPRLMVWRITGAVT